MNANNDYARIARAIQYLDRHAERQPGLRELSAALHLSEFHLQRLFLRWAGISPKRFLQALTGRRAAESGQQADPTFALVLENSGIDPADFETGMREAAALGINFERQPGAVHAFKDLMMPALVRVGAITPRTRALLAEEGIRIFDDMSVLESLEDTQTGEVQVGA